MITLVIGWFIIAIVVSLIVGKSISWADGNDRISG